MPEDVLLLDAEASLKWASAGEFSARITPKQAQALLTEMTRLRDADRRYRLHLDQVEHEQRRRVAARFGESGIGVPPDFGRSSA